MTKRNENDRGRKKYRDSHALIKEEKGSGLRVVTGE
jgi:hypothetical protein